MSNTFPDGYRVISVKGDTITIGMFDFLLMFEHAEPEITYKGDLYKRGPLAIMSADMGGVYCSCREYNKVVS